MFLKYMLAFSSNACRSDSFLQFELAVQAPFISVLIYLIHTVSTLLPGMVITNTALLVGHEIILPSRNLQL